MSNIVRFKNNLPTGTKTHRQVAKQVGRMRLRRAVAQAGMQEIGELHVGTEAMVAVTLNAIQEIVLDPSYFDGHDVEKRTAMYLKAIEHIIEVADVQIMNEVAAELDEGTSLGDFIADLFG